MEKVISGKVREVYDIENGELVIVTTDRISAFDVILPTLVENKGKILNCISLFWFDYTKDIINNHIISSNLNNMPNYFHKKEYEERTVLVKKLKIVPFEFIVRGYIFGNMWKAYEQNKEFCGQKIIGNYKKADKLEKPILTVSTKSSTGHDEYISFDRFEAEIGKENAKKIRDVSFELYNKCYKYAFERGIIIADTKFEFGFDEYGNLVLADEIFTPDCSRFWEKSAYVAGSSPKSYDKQFLRDWLLNNLKNGEMQFNAVPSEIISKTQQLYMKCKDQLLNNNLS